AEVPHFLADEEFRSRLVTNVTNPIVRDYWRHEYDSLRRGGQLQAAASTGRKIRHFLRNPLLYRIVGSSRTTVDFRRAMDEGWGLVVRLPIGELGEETVQVVGAVVIERLLQAA